MTQRCIFSLVSPIANKQSRLGAAARCGRRVGSRM